MNDVTSKIFLRQFIDEDIIPENFQNHMHLEEVCQGLESSFSIMSPDSLTDFANHVIPILTESPRIDIFNENIAHLILDRISLQDAALVSCLRLINTLLFLFKGQYSINVLEHCRAVLDEIKENLNDEVMIHKLHLASILSDDNSIRKEYIQTALNNPDNYYSIGYLYSIIENADEEDIKQIQSVVPSALMLDDDDSILLGINIMIRIISYKPEFIEYAAQTANVLTLCILIKQDKLHPKLLKHALHCFFLIFHHKSCHASGILSEKFVQNLFAILHHPEAGVRSECFSCIERAIACFPDCSELFVPLIFDAVTYTIENERYDLSAIACACIRDLMYACSDKVLIPLFTSDVLVATSLKITELDDTDRKNWLQAFLIGLHNTEKIGAEALESAIAFFNSDEIQQMIQSLPDVEARVLIEKVSVTKK